ncbi:hypothetical protein LshimejAT787_2001240 [Lyophyllum shimeji]|uniref:Uncharacterized protein n=1 Tax=Lyophyllum shimeji TaxID=47721 RepID=A0A9P3URL4_LYOSH|nr:hypothetical protein LshimejAT787_2001240 [Lyophyllum shimeji]
MREKNDLAQQLKFARQRMAAYVPVEDLRGPLAQLGVEIRELSTNDGSRHWQVYSNVQDVWKNERRCWHRIQRRTLAEKTIAALKSKYRRYPHYAGESFEDWSMRVQYPDWWRISTVIRNDKLQGNRTAHRANREEMQWMIDFEDEEGEEGEILQEMFNIVDGETGWDDDGLGAHYDWR